MARRNPWEQTGYIAPTDSRVVTDDPLSKLTEEGASGFWQWLQNQTAYAKAEEATDKANKFTLKTQKNDQEFALRKLQEQAAEARIAEAERRDFERTQTKHEAMNAEIKALSELSLTSPYETRDRLIAFRAREDVPDYLIPSIEATIQNTTDRIERKEQRETILEKLRHASTSVGVRKASIEEWDKWLNMQDEHGRYYLSPSDKITMDELRSKTEKEIGIAGGKLGLDFGEELAETYFDALRVHQDVMDMGGYKNSDGTVNTKAQALAEKRIAALEARYETYISHSDPEQVKLLTSIRKWEEENKKQYEDLSEDDKNKLMFELQKEIKKEEALPSTPEEKVAEIIAKDKPVDYGSYDTVEVEDVTTGKKSRISGIEARTREKKGQLRVLRVVQAEAEAIKAQPPQIGRGVPVPIHKTTRNVLPKQIKQNYRFIDKKTGNEFAVIRKVVGDDEIERVLLYDMDAGKQLKELFAYDELFARFEGGFQK